MNQTLATLRETAALRETLSRVTRPITVESQADDGSWIARSFANEPAAVEFETRCRRRDVPTRRA